VNAEAAVLRLAAVAARRLSGEPAGRVHSVFPEAINLEMADGASGGRLASGCASYGLVTLHRAGPLRAPFAAACDSLVDATPGAAVVRAGDVLLIGARAVDLGGARVDTLAWPSPVPACAVLARLPAVEPTLPQLAARAEALGAAIWATDIAGFQVAAQRLLGLGPGLTPSGDDCLVGVLAGLWCHGDGWPERLGRLRGPLTSAARAATTVVAAEFIACALAGEFSEPLRVAVATGLPAELLAFGATSGRDTVLGIRTALAALP
jgi:hypothetical protein